MKSLNSILLAAILALMVTASTESSADQEKVKVQGSGTLFQNIAYTILENTDLLIYFWYGDDGVDCGEPSVQVSHIDETNNTIHYTVEPAGLAYTCEVRTADCQVGYSENGNGEMLIPFSYNHWMPICIL